MPTLKVKTKTNTLKNKLVRELQDQRARLQVLDCTPPASRPSLPRQPTCHLVRLLSIP